MSKMEIQDLPKEDIRYPLFTIGYEGADLQDFVATLKRLNVTCLADIRELPISRRKGFAKTALSTALGDAGIKYAHLKALGDPKPGREAAKSGDYSLFTRIFNQHMKTDEAQYALSNLGNIISKEIVCLMCYEHDHKTCHRNIVANLISDRMEINLKHVSVRIGIGKNR